MSTPSQPSVSDRLARMHQAVDAVLQSVGFSPDAFRACQAPPTHANARQTLPNPANARPTEPFQILQNEATCLNGSFPSTSTTPSASNHPRQSAPIPANARHDACPCKTNPPRPPHPTRPDRPLTPIQLRAARLLVAGHSTNAVAAALAIDRHTLAAWKTKPLFQLELRRLVEASFDTPAPRS